MSKNTEAYRSIPKLRLLLRLLLFLSSAQTQVKDLCWQGDARILWQGLDKAWWL
jgi:hypothetical protein